MEKTAKENEYKHVIGSIHTDKTLDDLSNKELKYILSKKENRPKELINKLKYLYDNDFAKSNALQDVYELGFAHGVSAERKRGK